MTLPQQIAIVTWAVLFIIPFRQRLYYFGFCALLVLVGGAEALEYAPALWVPVELVLGVADFFRETERRVTGKAKTGKP